MTFTFEVLKFLPVGEKNNKKLEILHLELQEVLHGLRFIKRWNLKNLIIIIHKGNITTRVYLLQTLSTFRH